MEKAARFPFHELTDIGLPAPRDNKGPYLFRIRLHQPLPPGGVSMLVENEHMDTISLYSMIGGKLKMLTQQWNSFPGTGRFGYPEFRLDGNTTDYYLLTTFRRDASLVIRLDSSARMDRWFSSVFFQLGLYYAVCVMFFIINLFLGVYLRDRLFLYYCLFQLFIVASIAYADGFFPVITSSRWLLNNGDIPLHWGLSATGCLFGLHFLGRFGRISLQWSAGWLAFSLVAYAASQATGSYILFLLGEASSLGLLAFLWLDAMREFSRHVYARFFVLGYGVFLLFAADYWVLRKFGIHWFDLYLGQLKSGSVIEMLVLSLAIVFRMKVLAAENAHYRTEIEHHIRRISELEAKSESDSGALIEMIRHKYSLSEREIEVLRGIADGLSNQQIADQLFLSVHTIKFHTRNLFDKLEVSSRTQVLSRLRE